MERKGSVLCWSMLALIVAAPLALHAEDKISYEMASYSDWPGGEEIAARDYDAAIAKARRHAWLDDTTALVATTNLCVAHTVKRELPAAAVACTKALSLARRVDSGTHAKHPRESATAKALLNRGVLRAVSGDSLGAASDFRTAAGLRTAREAAVRNLAALEASPAHRLALADAPAQ
jgi:hypothetical protein